jgi:choline dehydrogenase-like flavoprotein
LESEAAAKRRADAYAGCRAQAREIVRRARDAGILMLMSDGVEALDRDAVLKTTDSLRVLWRTAGDLSNVLRVLPSGAQVAATEVEARKLEEQLAEARTRTSVASARQEQAQVLHRATTRAGAAVAENRFRLLAPLVSDIFSRLDPHPVFKTFDFSLGVYRERGVANPIVRDDKFGVEADPLLVFSSSQANVAALSYFLALGWAAGKQRQLIVSTHDPRLAGLLERKLAPRTKSENTLVAAFRAWNRSGPDIQVRSVEPQLAEGAGRTLVMADAA